MNSSPSADEQVANAQLFDVSDFTDNDSKEEVNAVFFEDIESDYDTLSSSTPDQTIVVESDDTILIQNNNALTDEEDRILTDQEDRLFQFVNNTQKIESCILIAVENLSSVRKAKKMSRREQNELQGNNENNIGIDLDDIGLSWSLEESMVEMRELIKTSGLNLAGEMTQRLQEVNPRTYIGTGKVKEAQSLLDEINHQLEKAGENSCCTVVFDAELSPGQQKALENAFNKKVIENDFLAGADDDEVIKVVDRTALILDIFAQHAKTREGKLQESPRWYCFIMRIQMFDMMSW